MVSAHVSLNVRERSVAMMGAAEAAEAALMERLAAQTVNAKSPPWAAVI